MLYNVVMLCYNVIQCYHAMLLSHNATCNATNCKQLIFQLSIYLFDHIQFIFVHFNIVFTEQQKSNFILFRDCILKPDSTFLHRYFNEWCVRPWFCTCKVILGRGQPGLMRWILLYPWCRIDCLICWPAVQVLPLYCRCPHSFMCEIHTMDLSISAA